MPATSTGQYQTSEPRDGSHVVTSVHVWEVVEITLTSKGSYANPYVEVECWVDLEGPGFNRRVWGFWDGGPTFKVRVVAVTPGEWRWTSGSNRDDPGLNGHSGAFRAVAWSRAELERNPNRRGFLRATSNGHALEYADGSPFFMLGDTWWAASTWRYPLKGVTPAPDYEPHEGISFEEALAWRRRQGFNTIALIAAFPNWRCDAHPPKFTDSNGVPIRQAWEQPGRDTAAAMHADDGSLPFETWAHSDVVPDLDRINPAYFAMLDRKVQYLSNHGFVAFLETVRRDHGPAWKSYFDWPGSFARYVQYIVARYGAYSIIFSGIHLDWIHPVFCLPPSEFNAALSWHHATYGPLPFGQPHTTLIDRSTYRQFGHGSDAPWLTMHAVGNYPRNHSVTPLIEEMFRLSPPYPIANLEPYYPGWPGSRQVADEQPGMNSERDNYFARAQMYGSILSGGLAGHMYGSGAYSGTTTGEPRESGDRPYIWEALRYPSGGQMQHLAAFVFSVGPAYQRLVPARELLVPNTADNAPEDGLDGWSFMLRDPNGEHALLYFEQQAPMPRIGGLRPHRDYRLCWFNPVDGNWLDALVAMPADGDGTLRPSRFPDGAETSARRDWCLQLTLCT